MYLYKVCTYLTYLRRYECMYIYIASFTGAVQCNAVPGPGMKNERGDGRWMARMIRTTLPTQ